jgi:hypothetical protein
MVPYSGIRRLLDGLFLSTALFTLGSPLWAISRAEYVRLVNIETNILKVAFAGAGGVTAVEDAAVEAFVIRTEVLRDEFETQQASISVPSIGEMLLASVNPVSMTPVGATGMATFRFIDPGTGLPTAGPTIGSVVYEINIDPSLPGVFVPLGTSSNVTTQFSLPFSVTDRITTVRATPFDPGGSAIVIPGVGGFNVAGDIAVNIGAVPEPATQFLVVTAVVIGVGLARYRRRRGHGRWRGCADPV